MLRRLLHKIVPPENSLPLAITGLMNLIAFSGPKLLQVLGWSLPMHDMTAAFDRAFPFSPVWVFVYVAAFPFWIYQYSVVAKESRSLCYRLVAADFAAKVICLLFFVRMAQPVKPPVSSGGRTLCVGSRTIWLLDTPTNLFPSIHCFVSWLGTRYIYECRSLRHRGLTCTLCTVGSVLVFLATMFTKQHVFYDVISGVAVAEIGWLVARYTGLPRLFERLNGRFLRTKLAQMI